MERHNVIVQPDGLRVTVETGVLLTEALRRAGLAIQLSCGGKGTCGKCRVEIHPAAPEPTADDHRHLNPAEIARGVRLACRTVIDRDCSVLVSDDLRALAGRILVEGEARAFALDPAVTKRYIELPIPSLEDQAADLARLGRVLDPGRTACPDIDIEVLRELPAVLRAAEFQVTVTDIDGRIVSVEPGNTASRRFGLAVDLGTTTVVGTVVDLSDGADLAHASRLNAQVVYGEDTISRIAYALESAVARRDLADKIRSVVNDIVREAAGLAGIRPDEIYEASFAGNTTMSHLFLGLDPAGLSQIPFVPVANTAVNLPAEDLGIAIHPRGNLYVLPNIAGFVGSDTVAAMLACDFLTDGPARLLIDVGTNGELALQHRDTLMVCSTAAGPALEGAALSCGMRAAAGAVEHIRFTPEGMDLIVIGDTAPVGLCGSGIIDLLAELCDAGAIDEMGGIRAPADLPPAVPGWLTERIVTGGNGQPAILIARGNGAARDVLITQQDIRQIQLAKGAIAAGMELLLKQAGLVADDLHEVLLAGAFGNYITVERARRIGLLPPIPLDRIRFVGNAASTGAKMALLSRAVRRDADMIRHRSGHLELASLPEFMTVLTDHMQFPPECSL